MKTKEELTALKKEVEALNKKLAELNEEELAQVSGGGDKSSEKHGIPLAHNYAQPETRVIDCALQKCMDQQAFRG